MNSPEFRAELPYRKAGEVCRNCPHAKPLPIKSLPQFEPDPDQASIIMCAAPVVPVLRPHWGRTPDGLPIAMREVTYHQLKKECELSPNPDGSECDIAAMVQELERLGANGTVLSLKDLWGGDYNFDPREGPLKLPSGR